MSSWDTSTLIVAVVIPLTIRQPFAPTGRTAVPLPIATAASCRTVILPRTRSFVDLTLLLCSAGTGHLPLLVERGGRAGSWRRATSSSPLWAAPLWGLRALPLPSEAPEAARSDRRRESPSRPSTD